ncbi:MAG TPA: YceI family protein [Actinomycetes bacterium]
MTDTAGPEVQPRHKHHGGQRKHRGRRWLLGSVVVLVVLIAVAAALVKPQAGPPPLALPTAAAAPAAGPADGRWSLGAGSVAGFRVSQNILGKHADMVGRTHTLTGSITVAHDRVTAATFRLDLTTITIDGKPSSQFAQTLDSRRHPTVTVTLAQPITLPADLNTGATIPATATAQLALHGVTRLVTFPVTGRRNGAALEAAGSIPITFSDWAIKPQSYGPIGSLADQGVAEFLLVLHRQ